MRLKTTVEIAKKVYAVAELTVRDVWELWDSLPGAWSRAFVDRGVTPRPAGLGEQEVEELWAGIRAVNPGFFERSGQGEGGGPRPAKAELTGAVCRAIRAGHVQVWDYGWSVFMIAMEELSGADREGVQNMALAARVGYHADRRAWQQFMRPSKPAYARKYGNPALAERHGKR
ncbi:MAG: hypothetical protein V1816_10910 [Pseudomonadota bacterium]